MGLVRCDGAAGKVGITLAALFSMALTTLHATASDATSDRGARDEAMRAIPWRQMTTDARRASQLVIHDASIYRRLPTRVIDCDPEMFNFLFQHPEIVVDVWRLMGVSQVTVEKLQGGVYRGTDGAGTTGVVRFLYSDFGHSGENLAVIYASGSYEGKPFVTPLKAQSILLLRSSAVQESNGRHYVTVRIDSFVRIERLGIELVAKTVQPWISKTADRNFIETMSFVSNFSRTAEKNPQGMQRLATRLVSIDEPTRAELVALCFRTSERYAARPATNRTSSNFLAQHPELAVVRSR